MEQETSTIPANEVWHPIKGYEGIYEVSDFARVRSLDHIAQCKHRNGKTFTRKVQGRIATQRVNYNGYITVKLSKDGKSKNYFVHRLVAEAFIPNPKHLPFINHKDENPKNNLPSNLEWCTPYYNNNYKDEQIRPILRQDAGFEYCKEKMLDMKVKDLIKHLQKLDQDRNIWIIYDSVSAIDPRPSIADEVDAGHYSVGIRNMEIEVKQGDYIIRASC